MTRIRLETSVMRARHQSGVASYTKLLSKALTSHNSIDLELPIYPALLSRIYSKLQSQAVVPPFDMFMPSVDLTIFPNFATWPTIRTGLRATAIHDLTYLYYPEVVEAKNLAHLRRVVPRSINDADFIITVSESVKSELIREFALDPARCIVTPIPPDQAFFQKSNKEIHEKYGIPTEKYLYFIGNMEPRKNLSTLLRAYLQLPKSIRKEYSLILAGSKGWKNEVLQKELQQAINSGENVRHVGFIDQTDSPAMYQNASLFVMPSLYEGFGIPVLEAMASGTPVLAADIPSLKEVGSTHALYADPKDPDSFSQKIMTILQTTGIHHDELQESASRYSWNDNVDRIIEAYEKFKH